MKRRMTFALALCLAMTLGCQSSYTLDFRILSAPPVEVELSNSLVEIEEGAVVAAVVIPLDDDEPMRDVTELELTSANAKILRVNRLEDPDDVEDRGDWYFTFSGARAGQTVLEFFIYGDYEGSVPVVIREQSP